MTDLTKKGPMGLNGLSAAAAAAQLEAGDITSEALVRDCLARIEARDDEVRAWDYLDPDHAIDQAKALDATPRKSPLHGVPVAIKDIFDTFDMPTGHGFAPYEGKRWGVDSNCVAQLRAAGMVILGKAVTTQFACPVPRKTRNPHDPTRTPGGSSSGSAAAVADFMVPLANGTQTGGSVIGPAANCGVYGFKASLDGIDRGGFRHCKPTIDTIGLFGRSIDDVILMREVQTGEGPSVPLERDGRPRIGVVRSHAWDVAEPPMQAVVERAAALLAEAGAEVTDVTLDKNFADIEPDFAINNGWEGAISLVNEARDNLDSFNDHNRERVERVAEYKVEDFEGACKRIAAARVDMDALFGDYDAFISPSLGGEAAVGFERVGGHNFARLWTQMYTPCVNLPLFEGPNGLPVCFQVIGPRDSDGPTLAIANWVDARLREALGEVPVAV